MLNVILCLIVILSQIEVQCLVSGAVQENIIVSVNGTKLVPILNGGDTNEKTYEYIYNNTEEIYNVKCEKRNQTEGNLQFTQGLKMFYTYNRSDPSPQNISLMLYSASINQYTIGCAILNTDIAKINFVYNNPSFNAFQHVLDTKPNLVIIFLSAGVISVFINIICLFHCYMRMRVTKPVQGFHENTTNHNDIKNATSSKQRYDPTNEYYHPEELEIMVHKKPQSSPKGPPKCFRSHKSNYVNCKNSRGPAFNTINANNYKDLVTAQSSSSKTPRRSDLEDEITAEYVNIRDLSNKINVGGQIHMNNVNTVNREVKRNQLDPIDLRSKPGSSNDTKSGNYNYVYESLDKVLNRRHHKSERLKRNKEIEKKEYVKPYKTTIH